MRDTIGQIKLNRLVFMKIDAGCRLRGGIFMRHASYFKGFFLGIIGTGNLIAKCLVSEAQLPGILAEEVAELCPIMSFRLTDSAFPSSNCVCADPAFTFFL